MHLAAFAIVLLIALALVAWFVLSGRAAALFTADTTPTAAAQPLTYELLPALLTPTERECFAALTRWERGDAEIFAKVRVADVLAVRSRPGSSRGDFLRAHALIAQKHFDFVLVRQGDARPLLAIELDDKSHQRPDRAARDAVLERVCREACFTLVRVPAAAFYSPITLADRLAAPLAASRSASEKQTRGTGPKSV